MKLKVCGMRDHDNIHELLKLKPDFIGFIFYVKSKRYVGDDFVMPHFKSEVRRVGVFVNEPIGNLLDKVNKHTLDLVQLHGGESLEYVRKVKERGVRIIKVFSVYDKLPVEECEKFQNYVDYFLFDTMTPQYGGSGNQFDWSILSDYSLSKEFLLSGGISLQNIDEIKNMNLEMLCGIDVNSRFELSPALKNIELVKALKEKI